MVKRSSPDDHYREFLERFNNSEDELGIFLKKNFWLIIKTARKRFGANFDLDEIVSEAAAAYDRMKYYHNRRKPTKHTSSYIWFLNKQLDRSSRQGVVTDKTWDGRRYVENGNGMEMPDFNETMFDRLSHDSFFGDEGSPLEPEEEMFYGSSLIDPKEMEEDREESAFAGEEENPLAGEGNSSRFRAVSYGPKYLICFESFKGLLSTDLYMVLSALSERKMHRNRRHCERLLETRRSIGDVCRLLRSNLCHEISQAGHRLYVAVCVNGTCNNVLVAAPSEEEARKRLVPYGETLELRMMDAASGKLKELCAIA
jgi:hypothetical protein